MKKIKRFIKKWNDAIDNPIHLTNYELGDGTENEKEFTRGAKFMLEMLEDEFIKQ